MTASAALKFARDIGQSFNVLEAFVALETRRKMALYDLLMHGSMDGGSNFRKTVEFLWPQASHADATQLEAFLRQRLNVY
jgi:hypothetical protein